MECSTTVNLDRNIPSPSDAVCPSRKGTVNYCTSAPLSEKLPGIFTLLLLFTFCFYDLAFYSLYCYHIWFLYVNCYVTPVIKNHTLLFPKHLSFSEIRIPEFLTGWNAR